MDASELSEVSNLLSYLLVIVALFISAASTLKLMVRLYRVQASLLTLIVVLTALEPGRTRLALAFVAVLPMMLAVLVPTLLARASLGARRSAAVASRRDLARRIASQRGAVARVELTWLQNGGSRLAGGVSVTVDIVLIAAAFLVAYRLVYGPGGTLGALDASVAPSLAVTMALVLQGLFTMTNKLDIIGQVIGLLVIEHGLFLAAVRIAPPPLTYLFVWSLFFYVLVSLTILLWILPELHRASGSITVAENSVLKG